MRTRKRHVRYVRGNAIDPVSAPNQRWSLDFIHRASCTGAPTDCSTSSTILPARRSPSSRPSRSEVPMSSVFSKTSPTNAPSRGLCAPTMAQEFCSHRCCAGAQIAIFNGISSGLESQRRTPRSNRPTGRLRDELINPHLFGSIAEVRAAADLARRLQQRWASLGARLSDAAGIRGALSNYPTLTVIGNAENALGPHLQSDKAISTSSR